MSSSSSASRMRVIVCRPNLGKSLRAFPRRGDINHAVYEVSVVNIK